MKKGTDVPSALMDHSGEDPRETLLKKAGDLSTIEVLGSDVLLLTYMRPEKTKSGIILTDHARSEDAFQGKCFLVGKLGPLAFKDENGEKFRDIKEGDWICARASDGLALTLNPTNSVSSSDAVPCRIIQDIHIRLRVATPDAIY
jgi:co-chaperonin GroES (HSP10)